MHVALVIWMCWLTDVPPMSTVLATWLGQTPWSLDHQHHWPDAQHLLIDTQSMNPVVSHDIEDATTRIMIRQRWTTSKDGWQ